MLDLMVNPYDAVDTLTAAQERPTGTVFQYPIDYTIDAPPINEKEYLLNQNPIDDSNKFTRQIDIPSVLGLDLTDKSSTGVYEQPYSWKERDANPTPPEDATMLNNPAVDGLQTVNVTGLSPLGANFTGQSVIASGNDPASFYQSAAAMYPPSQDVNFQEASTEATKPSDCSWYDFPCKFGSIKGEVTILIVGLILLAIGIFALTR